MLLYCSLLSFQAAQVCAQNRIDATALNLRFWACLKSFAAQLPAGKGFARLYGLLSKDKKGATWLPLLLAHRTLAIHPARIFSKADDLVYWLGGTGWEAYDRKGDRTA
jgi:hypothetical protein